MKHKILILISVYFCLSCEQKKDKIPSNNRDLSNVEYIKINSIQEYQGLKYSEIFETLEYTRLETKDLNLIGNIYDIVIFKEKYYIVDKIKSKSIFVFNKKGEYLAKLGQNGKGPDEYRYPGSMEIDDYENEFLVHNNNRKELMRYDFNGTYNNNSVDLNSFFRAFKVLDEDLYALYFNKRSNKESKSDIEFDLHLVNKNGKIKKRMFPYYRNEKAAVSSSSNFFHKTNNGEILFFPAFNDTIYKYDNEDFLPKYIIDFGKYRLPRDLIESGRNFEKESSEYAYINDFIENKNKIFFTFMYKKTKYFCFYSKKTKILKFSNLFVNDLKGLFTFDKIFTNDGENLIGSVDPSKIEYYKKLYSNSGIDGNQLRENLIDTLMSSVLPSEIKKEYKKLFENINLSVNKEDIDFVNSINVLDNPILMTLKLKDF